MYFVIFVKLSSIESGLQSKLNERNVTRERERKDASEFDRSTKGMALRNQVITFVSFFVQVKWKHGEKCPTCAKIQEKRFSARSLFSSRVSLIRKKDGSLIRKTRSMERKLAGSNAKLAFAMKITFVSRGHFYIPSTTEAKIRAEFLITRWQISKRELSTVGQEGTWSNQVFDVSIDFLYIDKYAAVAATAMDVVN